jgi:recombination protein RecT
MTMNEQTAVAAKPKNTVADFFNSDRVKQEISKALPSHCKPDRQLRAMLTAMNRTPKLANCDLTSLYACFMTLSQLGLEPDGRRAHLIPYGTTCQLIIDYKGIVELVMRSGNVSYVHADVVCEHDSFEYDRGNLKQHKIDFRTPRGEAYAVYALCRFKDGTEKCEVMTMDEVDKIRDRSKASKSGPWVTDYNEMAKKTVFRRLSKWLPLSPEQRDVIEADDAIEIEAKVVTPKKPLRDVPLELEPAAAEPEPTDTAIATAETDFKVLIETLEALMEKDSVNHEQLMKWAVAKKLAKEGQAKEDLATKKLADIINGWETILLQVKG